eukprot:CAMPEP_0184707230 /NCGR_PEP_ID=MMETSP0313-20130426/37163_1 /TAXON_ID=2792 /ORGANISM="Porphyridium aerugineum, Strain SAG 1380-2" /LENGTH=420 /DNA_ID=CAMNT_0027168805 /DNA_START=249 /DNA_END=1511 /DNA_ORIENTATION=-
MSQPHGTLFVAPVPPTSFAATQSNKVITTKKCVPKRTSTSAIPLQCSMEFNTKIRVSSFDYTVSLMSSNQSSQMASPPSSSAASSSRSAYFQQQQDLLREQKQMRDRAAPQWLTAVFSGSAKYEVDWYTPSTSGSFGNVWFGSKTDSAEEVVLKQANETDLANKLFEQEVYINKKLKANTKAAKPSYWPELLDVIEYRSKPVLVWKKAGDGKTLEYFLDGMPIHQLYEVLGIEQDHMSSIRSNLFIKVVGELLLALKSLQSMGIYHRDIKPENIIVDHDDTDAPLKIIDFGSSCDWNTPFKKGLGVATCDPLYAAPEKHINILNPDRFDVYSVGLIGMKCLIPELTQNGNLRNFLTTTLSQYDNDLVAYCNRTGPNNLFQPVLNDPMGQRIFKVLSGMLTDSPANRSSVDKALSSGLFDL